MKFLLPNEIFFVILHPQKEPGMLTKIYENNPNAREINKVADILTHGGIVIIPTDTLYAFACSMEEKKAVEKIAQLKGFSTKQAHYSMLCKNLSQASEYVRPMDKDTYSILRECLPGPYTFIMEANNRVPRNYQNGGHTIGIRVPENKICESIIEAVGCPLIGTSVRLTNENQEKEYLTDPELIHETFGTQVAVVIDGGIGDIEPSTVVDCSGDEMELIRAGKGAWE